MYKLIIIFAVFWISQTSCIPLEPPENALMKLEDKLYSKLNDYSDQKLPALEERGKRSLNNGGKKKEIETYNVENFIQHSASGGCVCSKYTCGCCEHLEEPSIHLNSTICANATYLDEDIGISLTITVNEYAIFNETVSVRNPPPVCLGVPYVKEWAEACVRLYDIDATRVSLHACAEVEARMKHLLIAKYELGCFNIGPELLLAGDNQEMDNEIVPHVVLV